MEFSFNYIELIDNIDEQPPLMVVWAAFGVPLLMFLLTIPMYLIKQIGLKEMFNTAFGILYGGLTITWFIGFITQMIFLFTGVSGIRMLLVWAVMFLTYSVFTMFNYKIIQAWADEVKEGKIDFINEKIKSKKQ